ncbi:MAG: hypothetical protein HYZ75_03180 [Elusimicrobia bacterium]|nr:hypothetical protein [Elusimicrobiota bacterium]
MSVPEILVAALLSLPAAAAASESVGAADLIRPLLGRARAAEADLAIRADRWESPTTLEPVEALLRSPLDVPEAAGRRRAGPTGTLSEALLSAAGSAGFAWDRVLADVGPGVKPPRAVKDEGLRRALRRLAGSLQRARSEVDAGLASLKPGLRERVLGAMTALVLGDDPPEGGTEAAFETAGAFDPLPLIVAAHDLAWTIDEVLPALREAALGAVFTGRLRWETPGGVILLSGKQDDVFSDVDLEGVDVLVDLGGRSRYLASPALAGPGQVRVVVDMSHELTMERPNGAAGSATLGVALFVAPEPGTKTVRAGDFSLGAGLFGVGAAWLAGPLSVDAGRFSLGAGAFGVGVMVAAGDGSRLVSDLSSQGYGTTRGAGLFVLRGSGGKAECGLRRPDARESLGLLSLCQGVGLGPRAFAAGGVGTALVSGSSNSLRASYMAQGMGYWHGLGRLLIHGDGNRLQARRYAQGAGVHTAVGLLAVEGSRNEARTWGVGPGFGWDYGVGWLDVAGDDNVLAAEWASGRGDIDGHGFVAVRGERNRLALAGAAAGALRRNAPSYAFAAATGTGNILKTPEPDPWGADGGFTHDAALAAPPAEWPTVDREPFAEADARRVLKRVLAAELLPARERLAAWLSAMANAGLESHVPLTVAERILQDGTDAPGLLPSLVTVERFDELVWARLLLSAGGRRGARATAVELSVAKGQRRAVLAGMLSVFGNGAAETALATLADPDWRVRRAAAISLGILLDRETGDEPGRLVLLAEAERLCGKSAPEESFARLGSQRLGAYLQTLASDPDSSREDFIRVFRAAEGRVLDRLPIGHHAAREFAAVLAGRSRAACQALSKQGEEAEALVGPAAGAARRLLDDPEPEVVQAALTALAQLGRPEDAGLVAARLSDPSAMLREAAAGGLGRMGVAALSEIARALAAPEPALRALGALAAAQSSDPAGLALLDGAFKDAEAAVRGTAVAALFAVQDPLKPRRKDFGPALRLLAAEDPDPVVRSAAARAMAAVGG